MANRASSKLLPTEQNLTPVDLAAKLSSIMFVFLSIYYYQLSLSHQDWRYRFAKKFIYILVWQAFLQKHMLSSCEVILFHIMAVITFISILFWLTVVSYSI